MESMEVDMNRPMAWLETQPDHFRFRREGETTGVGRAASETSTDLCVLKLQNYNGDFQVVVSLVEKNSEEPHVNSLYSPEKGQWVIDANGREAKKKLRGPGSHSIPKLGVCRVKINKEDPRTAKNNTACVRFCFRIELNDYPAADSVSVITLYSQTVNDTRSAALGIAHINPDNAMWNSLAEVTILCFGAKRGTKVYFQTEDRSFREAAKVVMIHKMAAIVVHIPKFNDSRGGNVFVSLENEDGVSDSKPFAYLPEPTVEPTRMVNKRQLAREEQASPKRMRPGPSGLQTDSACDEQQATDDLKEILFDLAAGDIACDQTLSKRLISCKQMHEGEDEGGYTALATAIVMANFAVVRSFLEQLPLQPSARLLARQAFSDLHLSHLHLFAYTAAPRIPLDLLQLAIAAGFSPGTGDAGGNSLLHLLVRKERCSDLVAILRDPSLLADFKPHLNRTNHEGIAVLHAAVLAGNEEAVGAVLRAGADPNLPSRKTRLTALHFAAFAGSKKEVARLLIDGGAEVNATSLDEKTPLDIATDENNKDVIAILVENGGIKSLDVDNGNGEEEDEEEEEEEEDEEEVEQDQQEEEQTKSSAEPLPSLNIDELTKKMELLNSDDLKRLRSALPESQRKVLLEKAGSLSASLFLRFYRTHLLELETALRKIGKC